VSPSLTFLFTLLPPLLDATAATPPGATVPLPARDAPAARAHIQAVRIKEPIVLDGRLDDAAWTRAIPSDQFTQHQPNEGAPPSERTELRVLYDDEAIYIGIDCTQRLSPVTRRLMRRDRELPSDGVWLDIDSRRDGVSAFHFGINAAGSMIDAIHFNDVDYSSSWDETWEARVADTPQGYSAEFRIPLRVLRFDALPLQDFGLQVRRFIDARQEYDDWAFYPRGSGGLRAPLRPAGGAVRAAPRPAGRAASVRAGTAAFTHAGSQRGNAGRRHRPAAGRWRGRQWPTSPPS